jgi:hypothetical protein
VVKAQGNSKCGNSDTNCMGKPKGPKTVKVAGQVVERDPEGHFHGKGAQARGGGWLWWFVVVPAAADRGASIRLLPLCIPGCR